MKFYLFSELLHQLAFLSLIKVELNSTIFKFEFFIKLYILFLPFQMHFIFKMQHFRLIRCCYCCGIWHERERDTQNNVLCSQHILFMCTYNFLKSHFVGRKIEKWRYMFMFGGFLFWCWLLLLNDCEIMHSSRDTFFLFW